jgi:hypothetical protein
MALTTVPLLDQLAQLLRIWCGVTPVSLLAAWGAVSCPLAVPARRQHGGSTAAARRAVSVLLRHRCC